nr:hypothetical protein [Tanacetum cinerariifolium]
MFGQFMKMNTASSSGSRTLPSNTITNPKEDSKGITTQSENAYQGPTIPTTSSSLPQVVERETEIENPKPNYEPVVALVIEPVVSPVSALKPNQKPPIPYPSRLHDQKLRDKANDQKEIFPNLSRFKFQQIDAFLALEDDSTLLEVDHSYFYPEGDILLLESFLNDDPSLPPPTQGNYLPQVSPVYCVPKKGGFTVVENEENELIPTRLVTARNEYYCFLDGFSGYFQILIDPKIKKKLHSRALTEFLPTVACLLGYAMHRARSKAEKSHFIVNEGMVPGHKISKNGIEVDKAKVDVIAKLPHPTIVKGVVLGQRQENHFKPIDYASKTTTEAESHYTTTEKEMLAVVY